MPSSAVRDIRYDEDEQILFVTFVPTGHRYAYRNVPLDVYDDFMAAFSKGTFFNTHIRDRYEYDLIEPRE